MRNILLNLAPILVVMLVTIIGFTTFNDIEASPSDNNDECADLWTICAQEANYASATCNKYGSKSNWCKWADADADRACDNARNCR